MIIKEIENIFCRNGIDLIADESSNTLIPKGNNNGIIEADVVNLYGINLVSVSFLNEIQKNLVDNFKNIGEELLKTGSRLLFYDLNTHKEYFFKDLI